MSFHRWLANQEEAKNTVRGMLSVQASGNTWRGLLATPPGSPLEIILDAFRKETNIPLEIPFFAFIHFVSGMLLQRGSTIQGSIGTLHPELWTIVLAPSGSGKTFAHGVLQECSPAKSEFPEPASGARFIEALSQQNPALWFQDEIAQILKQVESAGSPLSECKSYLLRTYDNAKIERSTKQGTITVQTPVLGILGLNTPESFKKALSAESLLDGFAQRFGFVVAEKDPNRSMVDFPIYNRKRLIAACEKAFQALPQVPDLHPVYHLPMEADEAFKTSFGMLGHNQEDNESFFRRAMFRAFKYAVMYHLILGKEGDTIDAVDIGWGARLSNLHIVDMAKVLGKDDEFSQFNLLVDKARKLKQKLDFAGTPITARLIQQKVWGVKSNDEAKAILEML
jgi:hypothetical protein